MSKMMEIVNKELAGVPAVAEEGADGIMRIRPTSSTLTADDIEKMRLAAQKNPFRDECCLEIDERSDLSTEDLHNSLARQGVEVIGIDTRSDAPGVWFVRLAGRPDEATVAARKTLAKSAQKMARPLSRIKEDIKHVAESIAIYERSPQLADELATARDHMKRLEAEAADARAGR